MGRPKVTSLDWLQFEADSRTLAGRIAASAGSYDFILGINRGGAISAVLLSHLLDIRDLMTFTIQMTVSSAPDADRRAPVVMGGEILSILAGRHVLLVDDAVGSGRTLEVAREQLMRHGLGSLTTAATVWNQDEHRSLCPADFFGGVTPGWVLFPWEFEPIPT